jgi:hypothetical protein
MLRLKKIKKIFHFTLTLVRTLMDARTLNGANGRSDAHGRSWLMDVLGRSWTLAKFCHGTESLSLVSLPESVWTEFSYVRLLFDRLII